MGFDFNKILSAFLTSKGIDHDEIDSWDSDRYIRNWYGCETCGSNEIVETVTIYYFVLGPRGRRNRTYYEQETSFAEFLHELTGLDID